MFRISLSYEYRGKWDNVTFGEFRFIMIGRGDKEGSKSGVAVKVGPFRVGYYNKIVLFLVMFSNIFYSIFFFKSVFYSA